MHLGNILSESAKQLSAERGIDIETFAHALELALLSAYKKKYGENDTVRVVVDMKENDVSIYAEKEVVEEVVTPSHEVSVNEAKLLNPDASLGDILELEVTPQDLGRLASGVAKNSFAQYLREAEKLKIENDFRDRIGKLLYATITRIENNIVTVNLGRFEVPIAPRDQLPDQHYKVGGSLKVCLVDIKRDKLTGSPIHLSLTHPSFVRALMEREIPEIGQGIVEIKNIVRNAGIRTKVAVTSSREGIDPVGICMGEKSSRLRNIIQELGNEKIDILEWNEDPAEYILNALQPLQEVESIRLNHAHKLARVVVDDRNIASAIGKIGQNVGLASKLTGYHIDIRPLSQADKEFMSEEFEDAPPQS